MSAAARAKDTLSSFSLFKADDSSKAGVSAANAAGQDVFRKVLEVVIAELTHAPEAATAARASAVSGYKLPAAFAAVHSLTTRAVSAAVRLHAEPAEVIASLTGMGLQEPLASDIATVASRRRDALVEALREAVPQLPHLESLRTRVDVAISSASLPKVMRPVVTMEARTSDGAVHTFEVPPERFHELRYSVAKVLTDMGAIEGHPVLKIA